MFAQKRTQSVQKPECEVADPFAVLEDYADELTICKSPSRPAKEEADRRLKTERSKDPSDDMVKELHVQGEQHECLCPHTQADPEIASMYRLSNTGGLPLATPASLIDPKSSRYEKVRRPQPCEGGVNDMSPECKNKKIGGAVSKLADKDRAMRLKQTGRKKTSVEKPSSTNTLLSDDNSMFQGESHAERLLI